MLEQIVSHTFGISDLQTSDALKSNFHCAQLPLVLIFNHQLPKDQRLSLCEVLWSIFSNLMGHWTQIIGLRKSETFEKDLFLFSIRIESICCLRGIAWIIPVCWINYSVWLFKTGDTSKYILLKENVLLVCFRLNVGPADTNLSSSHPGLGWLCFQFVSAASTAASAAEMTFASHVKTIKG